MNPSRFQQIAELYRAALKLGPEARTAFLASVDPDLRREVDVLLAQAGDERGAAHEHQPEGSLADQTLADSTVTVVNVGTRLGPYKIEALIGAGGMGQVFRGVDTRLGRKVAIKVSHEKFNERFEREARAISALNHPHICTLYDVGPNFLVMELLEGFTLADEIKKGPLALEKVASYGAQIASALAEAHARGIVHRDLKPSNIMVTRHGVKVLDFGLAKMFSEADLTETNMIMGTPVYMAPEQVEGREADASTDLFPLGLILYEMATGRLPFPGASLGRMLAGGSQIPVRLPSQERERIPASLDGLVSKLLEKNPARRSASAAEVAHELSELAEQLGGPRRTARLHRRSTFVAAVAVPLLVAIASGGWFYERMEKRRWAREEAIPEVTKLAGELKPLAAFLVLQKAEEYLPGDPQLTQIVTSSTRHVSIKSAPVGAKVEIQDYLSPGNPWFSLGTTPLDRVQIPNGYFRWRVSKPGAGELVAAPPTTDTMQFQLKPEGTPVGMVPVEGGPWGNLIDFIGWVRFDLPAFDIDKFEVTNRQYQEFVDKDGYRKREYWKEKFVKDGQQLTWEQAMDLFRDPTGRPGPSTWEAGHFPQGKADYPVSGVSWYEAAAYAAFAGKALPTLGQWYKVAPPEFAAFRVNESNFGGRGPVAVGTSPGVGPYGTYDMAGNVREWCLNAVDDDQHFILGGAWRTQTYQALDPEALPPFDRSPMNGFRTVRNKAALPASVTAPLVRKSRDFSKAKPVSDDVFQAYKTMYAYDRRPLNAKAEGIVEDTVDWTKEKITIDAGYGNERLPIYLFLPKNVHRPLQTVVFFPSARVNFMPSSQNLGDIEFVDYVIKSGRALLYPIYKGTYERGGPKQALPGAIEDLQLVIQESKEVRRAVDYLETRPEQFDMKKLVYLGVSQGAAYGVIFTALEDRFKTVIFLDGGLFLGPALPARDQVNFAPRLKKPVLMVNGQFDFTFSPDRAQLPLLRMIGAPEADKKRVVSETAHDVSQDSVLLSKEVLGWLDKHLGRVN